MCNSNVLSGRGVNFCSREFLYLSSVSNQWAKTVCHVKLESTNEPYAIAKIAGIKMCESLIGSIMWIIGV